MTPQDGLGDTRPQCPRGYATEVQGPECRAPAFQAVKFWTCGYQLLEYTVTCTEFTSNRNLQLIMLYGRLVHVGETFNRFADFGL